MRFTCSAVTSRGAAIERIELADEKFHDQDDRSGYLGHLAAEAVEGADFVVLCTPVGSMEGLAKKMAPGLSATAAITDAGSGRIHQGIQHQI